MICPRCKEEIDWIYARFVESGSCMVFPGDGSHNHDPEELILSEHTCPKCKGDISEEEASDLTE